MEICPPDPPRRTPKPSIIEAKNKIRLGHDACCNCCCCCMPQPTAYKYVQPEVPKSFAPLRYYLKSDVPLDKDTTYRLSYWESPSIPTEPIRPEDNLICGDAAMSKETTHRMSYLGNWCVKPESPITPCTRQWLGRGPMQDVTTNKRDYSWKCAKRAEPFRMRNNLYPPCAALSDDTTYRTSYYNSACLLPVPSYAPVRKYVKSDVPMEGCTTYRLSYWPHEIPTREQQPWSQKREYYRPVVPMDGCTTYKLSYWPPCDEKRPEPIVQQSAENLLNAGCCFDENTTYRLSYFGCGGDKPDLIRQPNNMIFSDCPLSHETVTRLSYPGNWCIKPEAPCTPCDRQWLGRGPMLDKTTQMCDYTWKQGIPLAQQRPEDNLSLSSLPLESCTVHKLSYIPNDYTRLLPVKSYAPEQKYQPSDVSMESDTTMRLSYQPVEPIDKIEKPWAAKFSYHQPITPMEDNTTYNMSYIPPGTLVPLQTCSASCLPADNYQIPSQQSCSAS